MLPIDFLARMQRQLGEEYPAFLESMARPRAVALRFNPRKGAPCPLPFVREPVPWEPMGNYYDPESRPGLHPYHDAGVYYLQEASAMAPVALLDPQPGEWICDLCAAPGGKATQIAGRMAGQGLLLCNEWNPGRSKVLSRNIERMGAANALVTNAHPEELAKRFSGCFDRVLVDAPCSGEGMFRKEADAVTDWSVDTVQMCARRQLEILRSAAALVRPGGRLVYSTCTFSPEENEMTVAAFLRGNPCFRPENLSAPWFTPGENGSFRLWPHKLLGEGHFAAVLQRIDGQTGSALPAPSEALPRAWKDFGAEMGIVLPEGKAVRFGGRIYWSPTDLPELKGLKVLRPGLELGEEKNGRFVPAHALAMWMKHCSRTVELPPDGTEVIRYLQGNVLPTGEKGWTLVTTGAYSLGWGKADGSVLKNHYPKGLRRFG